MFVWAGLFVVVLVCVVVVVVVVVVVYVRGDTVISRDSMNKEFCIPYIFGFCELLVRP